tara:strand:+ start:170 stop:868 length:699 start_codon:yes stop_codon:yes gene_type:complete
MTDYNVKYYNYDQKKFPFDKIVKDIYGIKELNDIHLLLQNSNNNLFTNQNDDSTLIHSIFYKKLNSGWEEFTTLYYELVKMIMEDVFNEKSIVYQASPNFRVQLPNNIAVGGNKKDLPERYGWHKDTDKQYDHPNFEKNFILPLTNSSNTASVYIETYPNSDKFIPADMKVGEFFQFYGGKCIHGNKPNETGKSRVSLDFRLVPSEDYNEVSSISSKITSKKFVVGSYYKKI